MHLRARRNSTSSASLGLEKWKAQPDPARFHWDHAKRGFRFLGSGLGFCRHHRAAAEVRNQRVS